MRQGGALAAFHDLAPTEESFRDAALFGLTRRAKSLPCRFLYDERGSALFEEICELPEYYPTRTEMGILPTTRLRSPPRSGPMRSSSSSAAVPAARCGCCSMRWCRPPLMWRSISHARSSAAPRRRSPPTFPDVPVVAICADYTEPLRLPPLPARSEGRRVGFFPGSTIGNFAPGDAVAIFSRDAAASSAAAVAC